MSEQPVIKTERLILRPFKLSDSPQVQHLASDKEIASTTLTIPHPYESGVAEDWIGTHAQRFQEGKAAVFALERQEDGRLLGAIGLEISPVHSRAEMGYWIGKPFWNRGYCTEAAAEMLRFGFEVLALNRIQARHFTRNPPSGKVMRKIGMTHEAHLRESVKKWDRFEDLELYAILKSDYEAKGERAGRTG
ncbi:MAG: GNAT family N-acetyltransferase [Acidobacteriota bacterium]